MSSEKVEVVANFGRRRTLGCAVAEQQLFDHLLLGRLPEPTRAPPLLPKITFGSFGPAVKFQQNKQKLGSKGGHLNI